MATENVTEPGAIEHNRYQWGEVLRGTKSQIQDAGIGVGTAFPGEPGAQPRQITVKDSRGLKARIKKGSRWRGPGIYEVEIPYPASMVERNRNEALAEARRAAEAKIRSWMHQSEDSYRRATMRAADAFGTIVISAMGAEHGYSMDAATIARATMLIDAITDLIEKGRVSFDQAAHDREFERYLVAEGFDPAAAARPKPALRLISSKGED